MKTKLPLLIPIIILFNSCVFDDSFDVALLDDFKSFQKVIQDNPSQIKDEYGWIIESNFDRLFDFTDENFKNKFIELYKQNKITRIEVLNEKCISFRIRPNYNNSFLKSEWKELWVIYNGECECVCLDKANALEIEDNWYKIITTKKRYIGG
ncbi:hypothetical protein [Bernardetia sp.]|uniref:hypothetical protein n=1 Tax=Bernardetia sp. TaxID=1937974 RepID=UPI0025C42E06|nr:hypothetical protein [Bernardetia sp.]